MSRFQNYNGDWVDLRNRYAPREIDLHFGKRQDGEYWERMAEVERLVREGLQRAQRDGVEWLLFTHGRSTSRRGATTARSVVRGFMRTPEATPFIVRLECIQGESVFLARIRSVSGANSPGGQA